MSYLSVFIMIYIYFLVIIVFCGIFHSNSNFYNQIHKINVRSTVLVFLGYTEASRTIQNLFSCKKVLKHEFEYFYVLYGNKCFVKKSVSNLEFTVKSVE